VKKTTYSKKDISRTLNIVLLTLIA